MKLFKKKKVMQKKIQVRSRDYNSALHDKFKALTVKQPWADKIMFGAKTIEVRSKRTNYRGKLVITSAAKPAGKRSGVTICTVQLVDVRPLENLTRVEMFATGIPEYRWKDYKGYAWILKDPKPVLNIPVKGQLGIFNLVMKKGVLKPIFDERPKKGLKAIWAFLSWLFT